MPGFTTPAPHRGPRDGASFSARGKREREGQRKGTDDLLRKKLGQDALFFCPLIWLPNGFAFTLPVLKESRTQAKFFASR